MKYYGVMVDELTGDVEDLEGDFDYKPAHESVGFAFAKWAKTKEERDKIKEYLTKEIQRMRAKG